MRYTTYTTEALVCGGRDRNTFDRSLLLYTREGGMLYAEARAARREHSKQRFALQDFTRVRVSLVRGKATWRIGSIEALENFYATAEGREARGSVVRLIKMVRRFARGEEAQTEVYDYVKEALTVVAGTISNRPYVDALIQVHFLGYLGYVAIASLPAPLQSINLVACQLAYKPEYLELLEGLIVSSIEHSHL